MKAFPDTSSLSQQQRKFNYSLSKARVVVEHSYGKLKGRWRCLLKRLDVDVCDVPELVIACCILHNLCEIHGDEFSEEWLDGVDNNGPVSSVSNSTRAEGNSKDIRSALMTHFNS